MPPPKLSHQALRSVYNQDLRGFGHQALRSGKNPDRAREYGCSFAETTAQAAGDIVFAAAFPRLKLAGRMNPAITGVKAQHNFPHRYAIEGYLTGWSDSKHNSLFG